jgi:hypothetical protein
LIAPSTIGLRDCSELGGDSRDVLQPPG